MPPFIWNFEPQGFFRGFLDRETVKVNLFTRVEFVTYGYYFNLLYKLCKKRTQGKTFISCLI